MTEYKPRFGIKKITKKALEPETKLVQVYGIIDDGRPMCARCSMYISGRKYALLAAVGEPCVKCQSVVNDNGGWRRAKNIEIMALAVAEGS